MLPGRAAPLEPPRCVPLPRQTGQTRGLRLIDHWDASQSSPLLDTAIAAIDAANAQDPVSIEVGGEFFSKELVHAQRMTHWVLTLDPGADEAQLLAARAHHLRRWVSPRDSYPVGRAGYLRWRTAQKKRQAVEVGELLTTVGYPSDTAERVMAIVSKEDLGRTGAAQTHEDALCLVFLELQLDALMGRLGVDHAVEVLRRSFAKMSPAAIEAAGSVRLSEEGSALVAAASEQPAP